jgi:hypothetical protein
MYAVISHVEINDAKAADEMLHSQMIPMVKSMPGFVRAWWTVDRDDSRGVGVLVFDTEEHAQACADGAPQLSDDDPVQFTVPPEVVVLVAEA